MTTTAARLGFFCLIMGLASCGKREKAAAPVVAPTDDSAKVSLTSNKTIGNWSLASVSCDNADSPAVSLTALQTSAISSTVEIVKGEGRRVWHFGACEMTVAMRFDEITEANFLATDESISCNAACGASPVCNASGPIQYNYPYEISGENELTVHLPSAAAVGFCATNDQAVTFKYVR